MTADNLAIVRRVFDGLAASDSRPFVAAMADDFTWIMRGSTLWSGCYAGKAAVVGRLFTALRNAIEGPIRTVAHRFIAEGDTVVVLARGDNRVRTGERYANDYCFVCRLADGKLVELVEYLDTELVSVLGPPDFAAAA